MSVRDMSWRCLAIFVCSCILQTGPTWQAVAQEDARDGSAFFLGTASTGGTYHPVGVALSTLVKLKLLPEFDVDLTAVNTGGSKDNIELIRDDEIQFAIISALAGHEARAGVGQFADVEPDKNLRAVTTLWLSTDHVLVRDEAVESGTIADFLALKGRPVSVGRQDSGTLLENSALMSALGVDIDADFDPIELGYSESAEALVAGRIDGMSVSGGVPIGAVQEVFDQLGDGAVVLDIDDDQLKQVDSGRRIWQRMVIPSGTYPSQNRDIFTIGTPNILAVSADVDDEVVYQITKTIFEELEYLHGLHSTTRQISLDNAANPLPLPIHAGAERYFIEKGVELPPPPVELDPDLLPRFPSGDVARVTANQGTVTIFAGTEGDTSTRIAAELAATLRSADGGVRLLATNGGGIGQNLTDLLYLKGVDTALVRADLLNYAEDQEVYPAVRNKVTYISEMFPEEVHLLVGEDITDVGELAGKKINLGSPGSGSEVTASVILTKLGLNAEPTFLSARVAIESLKRDEIQAAFFVGGKPMPLLQQIEDDSGLKLLSLPTVDYFDSYTTAELSERDYPNLLGAGEILPTVAARTALMTYAWRSDSVRYPALDALTVALFQSLLTLQQDGHHPKWLEIDPTADFEGWQRFEPALRWLDDNQGTARRIVEEARLRLEQQNAEVDRIGAGGGEPILIEDETEQPNETDEAVAEDRPLDSALQEPAPALAAERSEEAASSEEATPSLEEAAPSEEAEPVEQAAPLVPSVPSVDVKPVADQPAANGAGSNGDAAKTKGPTTDLSTLPTRTGKNPTF